MFLDTRTICLKLFDMTIIANHRSSVYVSHNASDCIFCEDAAAYRKGFHSDRFGKFKIHNFVFNHSFVNTKTLRPLQQSSCSDYYVHGGVNQPFDDHYFTVLVMYLRDNNFKEII